MNSTLDKRVKAAEKRLDELERSSAEELVTSDLIKQGVSAFKFFSTENNYYDTSLSARANYLNAEVKQLCKTVLFEKRLKSCTLARYGCRLPLETDGTARAVVGSGAPVPPSLSM